MCYTINTERKVHSDEKVSIDQKHSGKHVYKDLFPAGKKNYKEGTSPWNSEPRPLTAEVSE